METISQPEWQPIATAPFGRDLELAVFDADGSHALVFPCRRAVGGWVTAKSAAMVIVHPTHWREWREKVKPSPHPSS